jgi:predicted RNA binding protein YcfA (HicA-like mRNA interferase family)
LKVRDLVRLLESHGWTLRRIKGSHRQFKHPRTGAVVTVAGQAGKDVPTGTLRAILKSAGLEKEIWKS